MKNIVLFILFLTLTTSTFSQGCPETETLNPYNLQFNIGLIATSDPNDYPDEIQILASDNTTWITYEKTSIDDETGYNIIHYDNPQPEPWEGAEIDLLNFSVTFNPTASDCIYINGVLPIEKYNFLTENIKVFPNALNKNDVLNLQFSNKINEYSVVIYDFNGRVLKTINNNSNKNLEISTSFLNSGIYFIKITSEGASITKKIIVAN